MKKIYEKYIVLSALLLATVALASYVSSLLTNVFALGAGCVILAIGVVASFRVMDRFYPKPAELTVGDVKSFFLSKTFWIGIAIIIINGLLPNIGLTEADQAEILALDWTNIVQALMGAVLIVIRKLEIFKVIS